MVRSLSCACFDPFSQIADSSCAHPQVFHDTSGDLKSLEKFGLKVPIHADLPVTTQLAKMGEVYLLDTKILYEAVVKNGGSDERSRSLTTMCSHLGLQPKATFFHNAGNDAHVRFFAVNIDKVLVAVKSRS